MSATLRRDAQRNRERIIEAARRAFAEHGLDVGVDEIARSAGVGMGTLYRRFPTKESLVHAIFEDRLDQLQPVIERALAAEDPWEGLVEMIVATVAQQTEDHGFGQMVVLRFGPEAVPADIRRRFFAPLEELLARAQASGQVRSDISAGDLPAIVRMAGASALGAGAAADCRRHVGLLLDGLRRR
ncbi:MAG: TetR/AcrR family transcriptional regulator [Actinobacteria bacterium]|nr:MAG: TetR/AcrR family transcriptional regulator [Actinomycetota bacterium]